MKTSTKFFLVACLLTLIAAVITVVNAYNPQLTAILAIPVAICGVAACISAGFALGVMSVASHSSRDDGGQSAEGHDDGRSEIESA